MWTSEGGWGAELAPLGATHRLSADEVEALGPFVQGLEPSQVPSRYVLNILPRMCWTCWPGQLLRKVWDRSSRPLRAEGCLLGLALLPLRRRDLVLPPMRTRGLAPLPLKAWVPSSRLLQPQGCVRLWVLLGPPFLLGPPLLCLLRL